MKNSQSSPKFNAAVNGTIALAVSISLVGCGGGGSSSTNTTTPPVTSVAAVSSLVTTVPAASYGGEAASAYNRLNAERQACGFGLVAQNSSLDASAAAHSYYEVTNNIGGHNETPGAPGFTGATPQDRANATGYNGSVGEGMWIGSTGDEAMRGLLSGVYHAIGLLGSYRDIGVSFRLWPVTTSQGVTINTNSYTLVTDLGTPKVAGAQLIGGSDVLTYPCDGSKGVNRQLRGETPNPVPGRDIGANPLGTPIVVMTRPGNTLTIASASMNQVGGPAVVLRTPVSQANDPNGYFQASQAYVAPDGPLAPNTRYHVQIDGTNNGVKFSTQFEFTTGAN